MKKYLNNKEIKNLVNDYKNKLDITLLMKKYNRSEGRIYAILRENNIILQPRKHKLNWGKIIKDYRAELTMRAIARKHNTTLPAIRYILKKNNIKTKSHYESTARTDLNYKQISKEYLLSKHITIQNLAKKYNCSQSTIRLILKRTSSKIRTTSEALKGKYVREKSFHWKGDITNLSHQLRNSHRYQMWKDDCLKRDNYTCQITNLKNIKLIVHHFKGFMKNPETRFNINNGITISEKLHILFHKQYGYGNNTKHQFNKFIQELAKDEK